MIKKLPRLILHPYTVLLVVPLILYIVLLPVMPLMEPDEGRYSAIPSEMIASSDYISPHLKGVDYFEKPVLDYWATALAFRIFGQNAFASRLSAGLSAWGLILLAFWMASRLRDRETGLYAAAILSTCIFHFSIGHIHVLDMPLAFFVCVAVWSGYVYFMESPVRKRWLYLLYLASALAFLTKGLIGIVFPFGILFLWLAFSRRWRDIVRLISPVGIALMLAVSLPWLILVQRANPDFFWFFFVHEHFLRYTTTIHGRYKPFLYFIPIVIGGIVPWLGFLPEARLGNRKNGAGGSIDKGKNEFLFLSIWVGFILLFFSCSSSKLIPYIAPLFPPLAVMLSFVFREYDAYEQGASGQRWFMYVSPILQSLILIIGITSPLTLMKDKAFPQSSWPLLVWPMIPLILLTFLPGLVRSSLKQGWFATIYLLAAIFLASSVFPAEKIMTPIRSALPVVRAVRQYVPGNAEIYQFKMCSYGFDFYTGKRTIIVDDFGELNYGIRKLNPASRIRYFPYSREFIQQIRDGRIAPYCLADDKDKIDLLRKARLDVRTLWTNDTYYLLQLSADQDRKGEVRDY